MSVEYTLAELMQTAELRLEWRAGPGALAGVAVRGAHSVEVEAPARWLSRGWLMLTTGLRLRDDESAQRELVRELHEAGISGLGFAEGVVLPAVPGAVLDEAERRGFPVFAVPLETPLRDVITAVHGSLLSSEVRDARRLASVQQCLVDALQEAEPRQAVLERFSAALGVGVIALDDQTAETFGAAPEAHELRVALDDHPALAHEVRLGEWNAFATPMPTAGGRTGWLVAASRRRDFRGALIKSATQSAVSLLAATDCLGRAARRQERAQRAAVLESLLDADPSQDLRIIGARAAAFGLDLREPWHVMVLASRHDDLTADRCLDVVERVLPPGAGILAVDYHDRVVALIQGQPASMADALDAVLADDPATLVGIGRAVDDLVDTDRSYRDARCAVENLHRSTITGHRVMRFEEMDVGAIVVSEAGTSRIQSRISPILSFLKDHEPLAVAIATYFEEKMDVVRASDRLFLHPNSLRYRLHRVEEILGLSLKDPAAITSLYIAIIADRGETGRSVPVPRTSV